MIEVDVRLSLNDVNIILAGLGKLPLEASLDVFAKMKRAGEAAVEAANKKPVEAQQQ